MKKLVVIALLIAGAMLAAKAICDRKAEWQGLSESEVRAKLDARMPDQVPAEKRDMIADKIVSTMRDRGVLADDQPVTEVSS